MGKYRVRFHKRCESTNYTGDQ